MSALGSRLAGCGAGVWAGEGEGEGAPEGGAGAGEGASKSRSKREGSWGLEAVVGLGGVAALRDEVRDEVGREDEGGAASRSIEVVAAALREGAGVEDEEVGAEEALTPP